MASGEIRSHAVLRLDSAGAILDTIAAYSLENTIWAVTDPSDPRASALYQQQPLSDAEIVTVSTFAPLIVRVDRSLRDADETGFFTVTAIRFGGDTVYSRSYRYEPIPLRGAHVDSLVAATAALVSNRSSPGAPTPARVAAWARDALYQPAYYPPVSEVVVGRDNSVWLRRERVQRDTTHWLVLNSDGEPRGVTRLPTNLLLLRADGDRVWGMERDELDVPYIVRYRVSPEVPLTRSR